MSKLADTFAWQMRVSEISWEGTEYYFWPGRKFRFDYVLSFEHKLALEIDGRGHAKWNRYHSDIEKFNEATIRGWRVIHVTTDMVHDGRGVALVIDALKRIS